MWELAWFSLGAGAVAFVGLFFLLVQINPSHEVSALGIIGGFPRWLLITGAGFLGALAGSISV